MSGSRAALPTADLARIVVFAAFIAVLGLFPGIQIAATGVPIVLQNFGPLLAGAVLGWRLATAATALFVALVALGLPLLSGGRGGLAALLGQSGGFVFGWILSALVTGLVVEYARRRQLPQLLLATFLGWVADYVIGIPWLAVVLRDFRTAAVGSLAYVPGDLVKVVLAAVIAGLVHRALPDLLPARRSTVS